MTEAKSPLLLPFAPIGYVPSLVVLGILIDTLLKLPALLAVAEVSVVPVQLLVLHPHRIVTVSPGAKPVPER